MKITSRDDVAAKGLLSKWSQLSNNVSSDFFKASDYLDVFLCFSFNDIRSVKIGRDEVKAPGNLLLFTPAVTKKGFVF